MCECKSGKLIRAVKATAVNTNATAADHDLSRFELEHICLDPKDGDLYLSWVKPGETLVEARSDTDVQIVRQTWA